MILGILWGLGVGVPAPKLVKLIQVDPVAEVVVSDVLLKYRGYKPSQIVSASKQTTPFLEARPGELLDFGPPKPLGHRQRSVRLGDEAEGKTLEEISAECGIA